MAGDSKLDQKHIRVLFAAVCVNEDILRRASKLFLEKALLENSYPLEDFLLKSVQDYFSEFAEMPDPEVLASRVQADWQASIEEGEWDGRVGDEEELTEIHRIAESFYVRPPAKLEQVANSIMNRLFEQCMRVKAQDMLGQRTAPVLSVLGNMQLELQAGMATASDRFASIFERRQAALAGRGKQTEIGISFVDYFIAGTGPASGDVIGHAAPRGGGKTTLASQVAVAVAKREQCVARNSGTRPKMVYLFQYESVKDPMTQMLVNVGYIPRDKVDQYLTEYDPKIFTTGRDYADYERKHFASQLKNAERTGKGYPLAEWGRLEKARAFIESHIQIVDFTGEDERNLDLAGNFVTGIKDYIDMHQRHVGEPGVAAVLVDYAGTCARIHISRTPGMSMDKHYRGLIDDLPLRCKREIANPTGCFVWISQQLAAAEAERRPGTAPSKNAFKDCKSFAENCDFALVSGVPTKDGHTVSCQSKARRGAPRPDQVIRLHGEFSRWIADDKEYAVVNGSVVARKDAEMFGMANLPPTIEDTMEM